MYGEDQTVLPRQGLHCVFLRFRHPLTGETLCLSAPLPQDMREAMMALGVEEKDSGCSLDG